MLCVDVNVLVDAFRPGNPSHAPVRSWLDAAVVGAEPVAVVPDVAAAFLRIVTNRRIFDDPTPLPDARTFVEALLAAPSTVLWCAGPRRWTYFLRLVDDLHLTGDDVPDALLAASALDMGAALVTSDRGFRRFPDLRVVYPSAAASAAGPPDLTRER